MRGLYVRKVQKIGGQQIVNIPKMIRKHLGIEEGDYVIWGDVDPDSAVVTRMSSDKMAELKGQEIFDYEHSKDRESDKGDGDESGSVADGGVKADTGGALGRHSGNNGGESDDGDPGHNDGAPSPEDSTGKDADPSSAGDDGNPGDRSESETEG